MSDTVTLVFPPPLHAWAANLRIGPPLYHLLLHDGSRALGKFTLCDAPLDRSLIMLSPSLIPQPVVCVTCLSNPAVADKKNFLTVPLAGNIQETTLMLTTSEEEARYGEKDGTHAGTGLSRVEITGQRPGALGGGEAGAGAPDRATATGHEAEPADHEEVVSSERRREDAAPVAQSPGTLAAHLPAPSTHVLDAYSARRTGLAPHYLTLWSMVIGLRAQRVFEFGTGESSTVMLDALQHTGGQLVSIATGFPPDKKEPAPWVRVVGLSQEVLRESKLPWLQGPFDLVLHDGSHTADVVTSDLLTIIPRIRRHGLLLIHDTKHSQHIGAMHRAVYDALVNSRRAYNIVTLSFAFGLTVVCMLDHLQPDPITPTHVDKPTSEHRTVLG